MATFNDTIDTAVKTYTIDPSHTQVQFAVRHLGFSKVRGRFGTFEGTVQVDPSDLSTLRTEAVIDPASVDTRDEKRDAHLRSADFFEVEKYPELTFRSTATEAGSGRDIRLSGDLTIHGVTKPVVLEGKYLGEATDPWGGQRVAFEAKTTVNRKDFGLNWNTILEAGGLLVGEEVEISLEVQAVEQ